MKEPGLQTAFLKAAGEVKDDLPVFGVVGEVRQADVRPATQSLSEGIGEFASGVRRRLEAKERGKNASHPRCLQEPSSNVAVALRDAEAVIGRMKIKPC